MSTQIRGAQIKVGTIANDRLTTDPLSRANHTGTQAQSTITNLVTDLSNKADLVAGKIPASQIPDIAISNTFVVASEGAMLALTTAETGDIAIRSDTSTTYILKGTDYSVLADWQLLATPGGGVLSFNSRTGAVSPTAGDYTATQVTFTPAGSIAATTVQAAIEEVASESVQASKQIFDDSFSGSINSSNTVFVLSATPVSGTVRVYLNGLRLKNTVDYTISSATITFVTAPLTGDTLVLDFLSQ